MTRSISGGATTSWTAAGSDAVVIGIKSSQSKSLLRAH